MATQNYNTTKERWEDIMPKYQSDWESHYGNKNNYRWQDYEPAYRYGWEMRSNPQYQGRSWNDVESNLRRDWESRYPNNAWDRFKDSIKDAWDNLTGHNH